MTHLGWGESEKLLLQIARNVRGRFDVEAIWQQTVTDMGQALKVSRCIICEYKASCERVRVAAEYRIEPYSSMLGLELPLEDDGKMQDMGFYRRAIATGEPVVVEDLGADDQFERQSMLVAIASYQNQPNAIISLHQCERVRAWSAAEIEFVRELAEQVGSAIACVTLSQELAEVRKQAQEAYSIRRKCLATMSDSLRNPLNCIIGPLKLIIDDMADSPEEEREFIEVAHGSALHLFEVINQMLHVGFHAAQRGQNAGITEQCEFK